MIKEGIININKPKGYTSHDCINVMRSLTGVKRIGHTGTLDPMASGVLPICIGTSARAAEYLDLDMKKYSCHILLGMETDTLDIWGNVVKDSSEKAKKLIQTGKITREHIEEILKNFKGLINQIPPKYSALKVDGKKLYEYARAGQDVEIKSRQVYIQNIELKTLSLDEKTFSFDVICSKGTYIRSICRDIGEALGCGAAMSGLTRTASGVFSIEDSVDLEFLKALKQGEDIRNPETGRVTQYARALPEEINEYIQNTDTPLVHFGKVILRDDRVKWFCDGGFIRQREADIVREPEYKTKTPPTGIREEFRHAYNVYCIKEGMEKFLGVAFFNEKENVFKGDKIFSRG